MKKQITLAGLLLLAGCSNETEDLSSQKTELKAEIKEIKDKMSREKTKSIAKNNTIEELNKELDLNATDDNTVTNEAYAQYFNTYSQAMSSAFSDYSSIDTDAAALESKPNILTKLKSIQAEIKASTTTFNDAFKKKNAPAAYRTIHEQVMAANEEFLGGMNDVVKAYEQSDQQTFEQGSQQLNEGINKIDSIQFQ